MSKTIRTIVSLVVSLVLFSAMTMAQAGVNNTEKDNNCLHSWNLPHCGLRLAGYEGTFTVFEDPE